MSTREEMKQKIEDELHAQGLYGDEFWRERNRRCYAELPQCRTCKHVLGLKGRDHFQVMPTGAVFGSCGLREPSQTNFRDVDKEGCDSHEEGPRHLPTATTRSSNVSPVRERIPLSDLSAETMANMDEEEWARWRAQQRGRDD